MPADWFALLLSLRVAVLSSAAALLLALWPAWVMARRDFPGKRETVALGASLALAPTVVFGYLLLPVFSWQIAVAVSLLSAVPYSMRAARAAFAALPRDYEDAALVVGASDWRIFWRIAVPLAHRPILAAVPRVFARTLLEFAATLLIAHRLPGPTGAASAAIAAAAACLAEYVERPVPRRTRA